MTQLHILSDKCRRVFVILRRHNHIQVRRHHAEQVAVGEHGDHVDNLQHPLPGAYTGPARKGTQINRNSSKSDVTCTGRASVRCVCERERAPVDEGGAASDGEFVQIHSSLHLVVDEGQQRAQREHDREHGAVAVLLYNRHTIRINCNAGIKGQLGSLLE